MATYVKTLQNKNGDIIAPRTTVSAVYLEDMETTIEDAIATKATTTTYLTTIPSASWTGSSAPFSKAVTVSGILSTDYPEFTVETTGTYATDILRKDEWAKIYRWVTSTDTITFYATEVPTVDIPIIVKVVR